MNWVLLSPHFDDAVLSCGGWIAAQRRGGARVAVWTVMAAPPAEATLSPLAQQVHADWPPAGPREMVALRQAEDRAALSRLGAEAVHLPWVDCIYRRGEGGGWLYETIFTAPAEEEARLLEALTQRLAALPPETEVVAPLALGGHVDHRLVRRAAEAAGRPCWYYADLPYGLQDPASLAPAAAGLSVRSWPLRDQDVADWLAAAAAYGSQIGALFGSQAAMNEALRAWAGTPPQARLWRSF